MAFNLCDSLSIPKHSRSSFRSNCRGESNVQNDQAGYRSRAHRVQRQCPLSRQTWWSRRSSKRRHTRSRRLISAAGIFAATSTTIGPIFAAPTTSPTEDLLRRPWLEQPGWRSRRRLLAWRRYRLPDHQLPAHRPDRRLLVRLRFHRLDHWHQRRTRPTPRPSAAWLLLANAYADLGTYYGFTPYVGAGIGGAHVKWDDLHNTIGPVTTVHEGAENWRFAWALMAGTAYCLTDNLKLDVGYRFSHINGGRMFELAACHRPRLRRRLQRARSTRRPALPVRRRYRMRRAAGPLRAGTGHPGLQVSPVTKFSRIATARQIAGRFSFGRLAQYVKKAANRLLSLTAT